MKSVATHSSAPLSALWQSMSHMGCVWTRRRREDESPTVWLSLAPPGLSVRSPETKQKICYIFAPSDSRAKNNDFSFKKSSGTLLSARNTFMLMLLSNDWGNVQSISFGLNSEALEGPRSFKKLPIVRGWFVNTPRLFSRPLQPPSGQFKG